MEYRLHNKIVNVACKIIIAVLTRNKATIKTLAIVSIVVPAQVGGGAA